MKRNLLRTLALVITVMMVLGVMVGCGSTTPKETKTEQTKAAAETKAADTGMKAANGVDISKKVELQFYMLGNAAADLPLISEELNKLTMKDLNCTVKLNYTTWTDVGNKYNLLLSSGQPIDLLFTADWMNYNQFAKKGAFKELDELVPKIIPEIQKFVPKDMWDGVKVDGKIYTIPATWKEYVTSGFMYREDLRKKYNLPEPNSLETIEAYLDGIKKNEKQMQPLAEGVADYTGGQFFLAWLAPYNVKYTPIATNIMPYGMMADVKTPRDIKSYWDSPEFVEDMKLLKRWSDKGFWSKSVLSSKDSAQVGFESGKVAACIDINPVKFNTSTIKIKDTYKEWEVGYFPYPKIHKLARPVHPTHNGFAIPKSSQNAERALMFYEKMVLDQTYNHLTEYGIKGKHYDIEDGKYYKMLGDNKTNGFQREAMNGWAWRNPNFQLFDKTFDTVLNLFKELDAFSTPDMYGGFVEDYTPYQAERAALFQVQTQYLCPLEAGFVPNVETAIKTFLDKAKGAGLEKIQKAYSEQWLKYCDQVGLK